LAISCFLKRKEACRKTCEGPAPNPLAALSLDLQFLDRFYIPTRYPDALPGSLAEGMPNEADALEALVLVRQIMQVATAADEQKDGS